MTLFICKRVLCLARRKRRGSKSLLKSVFKYARVGALAAPAVIHGVSGGSTFEKGKWILRDYTGYNIDSQSFEPQYLMRGWGPFLAVTLVTVGVQKLAGIIRKF